MTAGVADQGTEPVGKRASVPDLRQVTVWKESSVAAGASLAPPITIDNGAANGLFQAAMQESDVITRVSVRQPARPTPIEWWALGVVLGMAAARLVVAGSALLSADEAYYWQWTRPLQLSYYDHPAMVAYWIWGGIHLLGQTALGVRIAGTVSALGVSILVWDAGRLAFRSRQAGALAALWLNCTVLFGSAGVVITPDAPLLLFWTLALWSLVRLFDSGRAAYLYAAGLALGLGAISKYTMALVIPGIVATFLLFRPLRPWLRSRHAWLAVLLAGICTTPLLLWNLRNEFASFHKQLGHAFDSGTVSPVKNLLAYLGTQVGLVTPLLLLFCLWGMAWALWAGWRRQRPAWFLLGATSLPVLAFFVHHTLSGVVQPHWSGPAYIGGVMAAAGAWATRSERPSWARLAFLAAPIVGAVMTGLVLFQAATALLPIPIKIDALKRLGGWDELAAAVEQERRLHPCAFLLTETHQPTGVVSFYLPDHAPVFVQGPIRPSYYTAAEVAALRGRDGILITRTKGQPAGSLAPSAAGLLPYFDRVTPLRTVILHWGGRPADVYSLYLAEHYHGGLLTMGDGFPGALDKP